MMFGRTGRAAWRGLCQASGVLVLAIACVVSAAAWVYLMAGHGGFWLTSQRLPADGAPVGRGGLHRRRVGAQGGGEVAGHEARRHGAAHRGQAPHPRVGMPAG